MIIERDLGRLSDSYDVIVVGGGITGVCVAREAAGRGLRTILVDKGDVGHGTSSATSKYIHGGIRYLETYEFGVVRESLRERRVLALAAPHLVTQQRFLMPAWRWSKPSTALIGAGVGLYTLLGFDRNRHMPSDMKIPMPRWVPRRRLLRDVPWLDPDQLQGAFAYHDTFNVHPERLLLAFLKSAVAAGAQVFTHMEAIGFVHRPAGQGDDIEITGIRVADRLTGSEHEIHGRAVVNAGGPWMDLVLARLGRSMGVKVNRSKGIHLLTTPVGGLDAQGAPAVTDTVFARARNGHHVIVSPWQGMSFIGPTDTAVDDTPDTVRADATDVDLVLDTVNDTIAAGLPRLTHDDIQATTVGIRPLIVDESKDSYTTSRRHELYDHAPSGVRNLWSIGGGKWTTGRALGDETVRTLLRSAALDGVAVVDFDSRPPWPRTARSGGPTTRSRTSMPSSGRDRPDGVDDATMVHLARLYGTEYLDVIDLVVGRPAPRPSTVERAGAPRHRRSGRVRGHPRGRLHVVRRARSPPRPGHARQGVARRGRAGGSRGGRATRVVRRGHHRCGRCRARPPRSDRRPLAARTRLTRHRR